MTGGAVTITSYRSGLVHPDPTAEIVECPPSQRSRVARGKAVAGRSAVGPTRPARRARAGRPPPARRRRRLGFEQRTERLAEVLDELVNVEPAEATLRRRTAYQPALACPAALLAPEPARLSQRCAAIPAVGAEEGAG
jgi:hypothetical protein